jgi:hypothetical protein
MRAPVGSRDDLLHGCWVHSHEEDARGEMVFRRPEYPFPRARGRTELELRPDGTYVERFPGPVDVPEEATGRWQLKRDRLTLRPDERGAERSSTITSQERDRLTLRHWQETTKGAT